MCLEYLCCCRGPCSWWLGYYRGPEWGLLLWGLFLVALEFGLLVGCCCGPCALQACRVRCKAMLQAQASRRVVLGWTGSLALKDLPGGGLIAHAGRCRELWPLARLSAPTAPAAAPLLSPGKHLCAAPCAAESASHRRQRAWVLAGVLLFGFFLQACCFTGYFFPVYAALTTGQG